jgi:hypothetical protein
LLRRLRRGGSSGLARTVGLVVLALGFFAFVWYVTHHHTKFGDEAPWTHPIAVSGDEPHYLIVLNSILFDGDLDLHEDYRRVARGGYEAGVHFRGTPLTPHTIFVDRATGEWAAGSKVYDPRSLVSCGPYCYEFRRAHTSFATKPEPLVEVSIHPVAYPALLAAFIAPFRPAPMQIERFASTVVVVWVWLAVVATYLTARRSGFPTGAALASAALVGIASPFLAYANSFYTEPAIGLALIASLWALRSGRTVTAAILLFVAIAMRQAYPLVGAAWIAERAWARRWREAITLGAVLGVTCLGLGVFNHRLAGTPLIPPWEPIPGPLATFIDERSGLFLFVPWAVLSFLGLGFTFGRGAHSDTSLLRQTLWPVAGFALLLAAKGTPGACYGPRFWIALIPYLALGAVATARRIGRPARYALLVTAAIGCAIAIPGALQYPVLFNEPPWRAWSRW